MANEKQKDLEDVTRNSAFTHDERTMILEAMDMSLKATQRQINTREGAVKSAYEIQRGVLESLRTKIINLL